MHRTSSRLLPPRVFYATLLLLAGAALLLIPASTKFGLRAEAEGPLCPSEPCAVQQRIYLPVINSHYRASGPTVFGIQVYGSLEGPNARLGLASEANVRWLRTQIGWRWVEPTNVAQEDIDFRGYDSSLLNAVRHGIRPIVTILDNPAWAATYQNGPIDKVDMEEFGEFVGAAVERYDGDGFLDAPGSPVVNDWEFYNEPDSADVLRAQRGQGYWGDHGAEYAEMLCWAHWYAKSANPNANIIFGGVAHDNFKADGGPFEPGFVDDVLAAGGGNCFDIMNFHYYPLFAPRWDPYGPGISGKAEYFRAKLDKYGIGDKPLMCTEAGWHSDLDYELPSSPQKQADFVVKLFTHTKVARLIANIWWTWIDPGAVVGGFGLLTEGLATKPAYHAYNFAASRLGHATYERSLSVQELGSDALEGYLFSDTTPLYVLWSKDSDVRTVRLPGGQARILNIYGTSLGIVTDAQDGVADGLVSVAIGSSPGYVQMLQ